MPRYQVVRHYDGVSRHSPAIGEFHFGQLCYHWPIREKILRGNWRTRRWSGERKYPRWIGDGRPERRKEEKENINGEHEIPIFAASFSRHRQAFLKLDISRSERHATVDKPRSREISILGGIPYCTIQIIEHSRGTCHPMPAMDQSNTANDTSRISVRGRRCVCGRSLQGACGGADFQDLPT